MSGMLGRLADLASRTSATARPTRPVRLDKEQVAGAARDAAREPTLDACTVSPDIRRNRGGSNRLNGCSQGGNGGERST